MHFAIPSHGPFRTLPGFEQINRYWDNTRHIYAAKLLPGEFYVTRHEELITTVLGSCVSACVWDQASGIGGMNHFMLPHDVGGAGTWGKVEALRASTRFGSYAMEQLLNELLKNGASRRNLQAKVFGGGRILAQMTDVGARNTAFVRHFLQTEGLPVLAADLGGVYPRKVVFYPRSGRVLMKKLRTLHNDTIVKREQSYLRAIDAQPVQGSVELF